MTRSGYLILGRVVRSHGVRGDIQVALFPESWEPFRSLTHCWLGPSGGPFQPFKLERGRGENRRVVLKLAGVDSPEAAAALVGREVAVLRSEAPPPPEGSFYHYDILGLEVVEGSQSLGFVHEIVETKAHDVYVIQGPAGEWHLPATRAHIRRIDLEAGRIEIEPLPGLVNSSWGGEASAEAV